MSPSNRISNTSSSKEMFTTMVQIIKALLQLDCFSPHRQSPSISFRQSPTKSLRQTPSTSIRQSSFASDLQNDPNDAETLIYTCSSTLCLSPPRQSTSTFSRQTPSAPNHKNGSSLLHFYICLNITKI
jgi:hypothetical protein